MTERQNDRKTEGQTGQIQYSPHLNEILTSIKGHNSVANLRKMTLYNPNIDLINVNVYTNFG